LNDADRNELRKTIDVLSTLVQEERQRADRERQQAETEAAAMRRLVLSLLNSTPSGAAVAEMNDALQRQMEFILDYLARIRSALLVILPATDAGKEAKRILNNLPLDPVDREAAESIVRQLAIQQSNLNIFKEKAATYGGDVPVKLLNDIKNTETEIGQRRQELQLLASGRFLLSGDDSSS
jgi:hypothetical protein